jgi:hypothetical protein
MPICHYHPGVAKQSQITTYHGVNLLGSPAAVTSEMNALARPVCMAFMMDWDAQAKSRSCLPPVIRKRTKMLLIVSGRGI